MRRATIDPFPGIQVFITQVGGGASPIGYAALVYPGTTIEQPVLDSNHNPIEDWTEEDCFLRAYEAMEGKCLPRWVWDKANFPLHTHPMLNGVQKMDAMSDCYQAAEMVSWALIR